MDHSLSPSQSASLGADEILYAKLKQAVRRVCPQWLRGQEEDLVQASMIRVQEMQKKSEGNHELSSSYVWSVAHNAMIDEIRRQRRRREVSLTDEEGVDLEPPHSSANPETMLHARQIGAGIRSCLEQIMTSRCLPLTLYLQGHSVPESSMILGWSAKKVENLVYRGLQELRTCLASKGMKP